MKIYYLSVDFGKKTRNPLSGMLGEPLLKASDRVTLYRDLDGDPHTLVAEAKGQSFHYPWSGVVAVVDKERTYPKPAEPEKKKAS